MRIEKEFEYVHVPDNQRVHLATYMLDGEAENWWKGEKVELQERGLEDSWEEFLKLFFERYFSDAAQEKKEQEFMMLLQGDRSVDAYRTEFEALARYAPLLVADERKKVRRFQKGLKLNIRNRLVPLGLSKFSQALSSARMIERDMEEQKEEAAYRQGRGKPVVNHPRPVRVDPRGKRPATE